jgi:hypothetical protein
MPASDAQIAANRRNSKLSTGPKTIDGKEKSRRNALKHGLTGEGVALPDEDAAEVAARFKELEAELLPSGMSSRMALRRFAYLSVRLERCERLDTAVYSKRIRHADEDFLDHRMTRVEEIASRLESDPMTASRRLQLFPEGVDYLIKQWHVLRDDLMNRERRAWTMNHRTRLDQLLGNIPGGFRISRNHALTEGLNGFFMNINPSEIEGLNEHEQVEWARGELAKIIDAEIERLHDVKANLDPSIIEADRQEAAARCLFDLQPAMNQVRKYEAATERNMYKALNEFRQLEKELKANGIDTEEDRSPAELASFDPKTGEPEQLAESQAEQPPQPPKPPAQIPETIHFPSKRDLSAAANFFGSQELGLI